MVPGLVGGGPKGIRLGEGDVTGVTPLLGRLEGAGTLLLSWPEAGVGAGFSSGVLSDKALSTGRERRPSALAATAEGLLVGCG